MITEILRKGVPRRCGRTGQAITWEEILASELDLVPDTFAFGPLPVTPVARPGLTQLSRPPFGHVRETQASGSR